MNETVAPKLSPKPEDVRALRRWLSQIYMDWTLKKTGVAWSDHAADLIITRYGALPSKPKDENALLNSIKREINALQEGVGVVVRLCDQMNYSVGKGVTIQTTLTPEQQAVLDAAQAYRDEPRGGNYKTGLWSCLMGKVMKLPATVVMDPVQVGVEAYDKAIRDGSNPRTNAVQKAIQAALAADRVARAGE